MWPRLSSFGWRPEGVHGGPDTGRMTVASETSSVSYSGNGVTTSFAVPFYFLENTHIVVTRTVAGVTTTLVEGVNYSVSGAGNPAGGTVTIIGAAPANGTTIEIRRNVPRTQLTSFRAQGSFSPALHETALDRVTMQVQQVHQDAIDAIDDMRDEVAALRDDIAADPDATALDERTVVVTGTTKARKLKDRFLKPLNILDFDPDPSGVSDSTTALTAALAALPSGGKLFIPTGIYKYSSRLLVDGVEGFHIIGEGKSSVLLPQGSISAAVELRNCHYFRIEGVQMQAIGMAGTGDGFVLDGSSYGKLDGCKILNAPGYGVKLGQFSGTGGAYFNIIEGAHFFNNGRLLSADAAANIYSGNEASETKVIGGECQASPGWGWLIEGSNGCTGLGASFEGNTKGGVKVGTSGAAGEVSLFGCRFEGAGVMERGVLVGNANSTLMAIGCHMTSCTVLDIDNSVGSAKVAWFNISPSTTPAGNTVGLRVRNSDGIDLGTLNISESGGAPTIQGPSLKIQSSANNLELGSATSIISSLAAVLRFSGNSRVDAAGSSTLYLGSSSNTLIADAPLACAHRFVLPVYTTAQRDALTSVGQGTVVFNSTTGKANLYTGSSWEEMTST